jgi:hypothetical protein
MPCSGKKYATVEKKQWEETVVIFQICLNIGISFQSGDINFEGHESMT